MSAADPLLDAIVSALAGDSAFMTLIGSRLYDGSAPRDTAFPYVLLGEDTEAIEATHSHDGYGHTVTLHEFSKLQGRTEVQQIRAAHVAVLDELVVSPTGWTATSLRYEFGTVLVQWDDELKVHLRHGVSRYRVSTLES